jgi:hypothetical protein
MEEERIIQMLQEQTKILKSLQRTQRLSTVFGILKLLLIIVPIIWLYFYLPSLISGYTDVLQNSILGQDVISLPEGFSFDSIQQLLERN